MKWGGDAVLLLFDGEGPRRARVPGRARRCTGRCANGAGCRAPPGSSPCACRSGSTRGTSTSSSSGGAHRELVVAGPAPRERCASNARRPPARWCSARRPPCMLDPVTMGRRQGRWISPAERAGGSRPGRVPAPDLAGLDLERGLPAGLRDIRQERRLPRPSIVGRDRVHRVPRDRRAARARRARGGRERARRVRPNGPGGSPTGKGVSSWRGTSRDNGGKILLVAGAPVSCRPRRGDGCSSQRRGDHGRGRRASNQDRDDLRAASSP